MHPVNRELLHAPIRIGSDVYRVSLLSSRSFRRRNRRRSRETKPSIGRIVRPAAFNGAWHNARVHEECSHRCIHRWQPLLPRVYTQRAAHPRSSPAICFSKRPPLPSRTPSDPSTPSSAVDPRPRGLLRSNNPYAAASPGEMHRFHYKLLMRQICLPFPMRYRRCAIVTRGHCPFPWIIISDRPPKNRKINRAGRKETGKSVSAVENNISPTRIRESLFGRPLIIIDATGMSAHLRQRETFAWHSVKPADEPAYE